MIFLVGSRGLMNQHKSIDYDWKSGLESRFLLRLLYKSLDDFRTILLSSRSLAGDRH